MVRFSRLGLGLGLGLILGLCLCMMNKSVKLISGKKSPSNNAIKIVNDGVPIAAW